MVPVIGLEFIEWVAYLVGMILHNDLQKCAPTPVLFLLSAGDQAKGLTWGLMLKIPPLKQVLAFFIWM